MALHVSQGLPKEHQLQPEHWPLALMSQGDLPANQTRLCRHRLVLGGEMKLVSKPRNRARTTPPLLPSASCLPTHPADGVLQVHCSPTAPACCHPWFDFFSHGPNIWLRNRILYLICCVTPSSGMGCPCRGAQTSPKDEPPRGDVSVPPHNDRAKHNTALCQNNHSHCSHALTVCASH